MYQIYVNFIGGNPTQPADAAASDLSNVDFADLSEATLQALASALDSYLISLGYLKS